MSVISGLSAALSAGFSGICQPLFIPDLPGICQSLSIFRWNVKRFLIEFVRVESGREYTHSVHYTKKNECIIYLTIIIIIIVIIIMKRSLVLPIDDDRNQLCPPPSFIIFHHLSSSFVHWSLISSFIVIKWLCTIMDSGSVFWWWWWSTCMMDDYGMSDFVANDDGDAYSWMIVDGDICW